MVVSRAFMAPAVYIEVTCVSQQLWSTVVEAVSGHEFGGICVPIVRSGIQRLRGISAKRTRRVMDMRP